MTTPIETQIQLSPTDPVTWQQLCQIIDQDQLQLLTRCETITIKYTNDKIQMLQEFETIEDCIR